MKTLLALIITCAAYGQVTINPIGPPFDFTGVSAATGATKAAVQAGTYQYCRSTTGNDTYTCALTPALTAYTTGGCLVLNPDTGNTLTATINVDSLGAKSILNRAVGTLATGDITANAPITICYDGTRYIIQGDGSGAVSSVTAGATGALVISPTTGAVVADIDTAYVPAKTAANTFTGINTFNGSRTEVKHLVGVGSAPTISAGFGTTPSVAGTDVAARITVGTGGTAQTGTLTFAVAYSTAPACVANNESSQILVLATATTTTVALASSSAWGASDTITVICIGF